MQEQAAQEAAAVHVGSPPETTSADYGSTAVLAVDSDGWYLADGSRPRRQGAWLSSPPTAPLAVGDADVSTEPQTGRKRKVQDVRKEEKTYANGVAITNGDSKGVNGEDSSSQTKDLGSGAIVKDLAH